MDWRDEQIKELTRLVAELRAALAQRDEIIADLKRQLALNSGNSSKPPSSDGFKKQSRVRSLREKSGKKSGGQPGHKGSTLQQVENPDFIEIHKINHCPHCNTNLTDVPVDDISRKQVVDIPLVKKPFVTEHQFEMKRCPGCHKKVTPQGDDFAGAPVKYGDNIKAVTTYLHVHNLVPEQRTAQIMKDLHGVPMSSATVENIIKGCVERVAPVVEYIKKDLAKASHKCADESGARVAGKLHWVHTVSNARSVHYRISEKRGDISTDLVGTVMHDCFSSYFSKLDNVQHALCNSHILRELKALIEIDKEPWARNMRRLLLVGLKKQPQNITTEWLVRFKKLYCEIVQKGLAFHEDLGVLNKPKRGAAKRRPGHNLLRRLQKYDVAVLRFLEDPEVPFTNNCAEQSIRMVKIKQKISGCFRTIDGAKNFVTVRSYTATAQKRGFKILESLAYAFQGTPLLLTQN